MSAWGEEGLVVWAHEKVRPTAQLERAEEGNERARGAICLRQ